MSKENLEQFMEQVAGSEELQAKIGEEIDAEALIALGAECGCEFTAEELQDSAELSDEELGTVAGGFGIGDVLGGDALGARSIVGGTRRKLRYNNGQEAFAISEAAVRGREGMQGQEANKED